MTPGRSIIAFAVPCAAVAAIVELLVPTVSAWAIVLGLALGVSGRTVWTLGIKLDKFERARIPLDDRARPMVVCAMVVVFVTAFAGAYRILVR